MCYPPELLAAARRTAEMRDPIRSPVAGWVPCPNGIVCEEPASSFAKRSGRNPQHMFAAIIIGFVAGRIDRQQNGRFSWTVFLSDPAETIDDIMDRLDAAALPMPTVADRLWYDHARRLSGRRGRPVPDHWISNYAGLADQFDGDTWLQEIGAEITCEREEARRVGAEVDFLRDGVRRTERMTAIEDVRAALRAALGPDVPPLNGTCLDPVIGKHIEAPGGEGAARLLSVLPALRSVAIAAASDALANGNLANNDKIPASLARMSVVLDGVADEKGFRIRVRQYLAKHILPSISDWVRIRDVFSWYGVERRWRLWAAEDTTSVQLKEWLLGNMPLAPRNDDFLDFLEEYHDKLRDGATARRRRRVDPMVGSMDRMLLEAEAILLDANRIFEESLVAHREADAAGSDDFRFSVELPVRDEAHAETGENFLLDLRSVRIGAQIKRLYDDHGAIRRHSNKGFLLEARSGGSKHDQDFDNGRLIVMDGAHGFAEGDPVRGSLAFLDPYVCGAVLAPSVLGDAQKAARRSYLAETGMPSPRLAPPNVITGDGSRERKIAVYSLSLRNEAVLPVAAMMRGLSAGRMLFRMVNMSHVRVTTARQLIDHKARGWTSLGGRAAFWAIPKLPHQMRVLPRSKKIRAFALDKVTVQAIKFNFKLVIRLDGAHPDNPKVAPVAKVGTVSPMPPECGDDQYCLQAFGSLMNISHLGYCQSFLFRRKLLPHDPRHVSATVRFDEGETVEAVGQAMGNKGKRTKAYVTRLDMGVRFGEGAAFIQKRDDIAALGTPKASRR